MAKLKPVAVWSNHACQVALLTRSSPASGNAPHGKEDNCIKDVRTNRPRHFKGHQRCPCPVRLAVTGLGKECTLTSIRSECEGAVGPSFSKGPVIFPVLNDDTAGPEKKRKAKTKASGQSRGESPKGNRQITKLGDDQERRNTHKWRKTD